MAKKIDPLNKKQYGAVSAMLTVSDIKASCDFFTQKLGFAIVFVYGEPPFYAQVKRDRGLLNLKCMDAPVIDPYVWTGGALQEKSVSWSNRVSHQCIRPLGGAHVCSWPSWI